MVAVASDRHRTDSFSFDTDFGINVGRLQNRINGIDVNVTGTPISDGRRRFLVNEYRHAKVACDLAAERKGIYIVDNGNDTLKLDPLKPGDVGIVRGYNDSSKIALNSYVVAGTELYNTFKGWIACKKGKLGRYLRGMFGTRDRADEAAKDTIQHEYGHKLQLKPIKTKDGKVSEPFRKALFQRLRKRYQDVLPKGMKWLSPLAAYFATVPLLEGLNEVAKDNIYNDKSASQIRKERLQGVTTYDAYTAPVAGFLEKRYGNRREALRSEALNFYSDYARRGVGAIDDLANSTVFAYMRN